MAHNKIDIHALSLIPISFTEIVLYLLLVWDFQPTSLF